MFINTHAWYDRRDLWWQNLGAQMTIGYGEARPALRPTAKRASLVTQMKNQIPHWSLMLRYRYRIHWLNLIISFIVCIKRLCMTLSAPCKVNLASTGIGFSLPVLQHVKVCSLKMCTCVLFLSGLCHIIEPIMIMMQKCCTAIPDEKDPWICVNVLDMKGGTYSKPQCILFITRKKRAAP